MCHSGGFRSPVEQVDFIKEYYSEKSGKKKIYAL